MPGGKVDNLRLFAYVSNWDKIKQEKFVTLIFKTNKYNGAPKLNPHNHQEFAWLSKAEIEKIRTVKYFKEIMECLD